MKFLASIALAALASCMSVPASQARPSGAPPEPEPERQLTLYLGGRSFDSEFWAPTEDQASFGIEFAEQGTLDSLGWEIGLAGSRDESTLLGFDVAGSTAELYAGLRKSFGSDTVRPYVGGGLALIDARFEAGGASEDDSSLAGYVHGGIEFLLSPTFLIGIDARLLFGSRIAIAGVSGDADYTQGALTLGWRF